jgi:Uma2 family endonuclease
MVHAMSLPAQEMTLEEWAAREEDAEGELVDGHLVEEEVADCTHEIVVAYLMRQLGNWGEPSGILVGASQGDFAVGPKRGRRPDAFAYLPGAPRPKRHGLMRVPPSIIIEVVSPVPRDRRRDLVEKVDDYARFGVKWYWLVDPAARTLQILELGAESRYVIVRNATEGVLDDVPGCPGLRLELDPLWRAIDTLPDDDTQAD